MEDAVKLSLLSWCLCVIDHCPAEGGYYHLESWVSLQLPQVTECVAVGNDTEKHLLQTTEAEGLAGLNFITC